MQSNTTTVLLSCCLFLSSQTGGSAQTASDAAEVARRLDALQRREDELSQRLDSELRAADKRFEGVTHSTDRAFNVLALLGAFGSFLGGLIVLLSWLRTRKSDKLQRTDYERERDFYENRVQSGPFMSQEWSGSISGTIVDPGIQTRQ